jgi:hypothetical protein
MRSDESLACQFHNPSRCQAEETGNYYFIDERFEGTEITAWFGNYRRCKKSSAMVRGEFTYD